MKFLNNIGKTSFWLSAAALVMLTALLILDVPQSNLFSRILVQVLFPLFYASIAGMVLSLIMRRSKEEVRFSLWALLMILIFGVVLVFGAVQSLAPQVI